MQEPAGYGALTEAAAFVSGEDRFLLEVEGERAAAMINGLVTNQVATLPVRRAVYAFLLTPKGRPIADPRILRPAEDRLWLDGPASAAEGVESHLRKFLPPMFAPFRPLEEMRRASVLGPRAEEAAASVLATGSGGGETHDGPEEDGGWLRAAEPLGMLPARLAVAASAVPAPDAASSGDGVGSKGPVAGPRAGPRAAGERDAGIGAEAGRTLWVVRREAAEGGGLDLYIPAGAYAEVRERLTAAAQSVGGGPATPEAYEIWRVERRIPLYGADITLDNLPQETGQEARAIRYDKGCYTGQEVVARIHYRGHVNRLLRALRFAEDPPAAGRTLYREDGRPAGAVTSAVRSPRLGAIGLGYVRRDVEPGAALALEPGGPPAAEVAELPGPAGG